MLMKIDTIKITLFTLLKKVYIYLLADKKRSEIFNDQNSSNNWGLKKYSKKPVSKS
jgi:hypothetical protein